MGVLLAYPITCLRADRYAFSSDIRPLGTSAPSPHEAPNTEITNTKSMMIFLMISESPCKTEIPPRCLLIPILEECDRMKRTLRSILPPGHRVVEGLYFVGGTALLTGSTLYGPSFVRRIFGR